MAEQLRGLFEKFVDWQQCAAVMLSCFFLHNSGALPPVQKLFRHPSYMGIIFGPSIWGNRVFENRGPRCIFRYKKY